MFVTVSLQIGLDATTTLSQMEVRSKEQEESRRNGRMRETRDVLEMDQSHSGGGLTPLTDQR